MSELRKKGETKGVDPPDIDIILRILPHFESNMEYADENALPVVPQRPRVRRDKTV